MSTIALQAAKITGTTVAFAAAAAGDKVEAGDGSILLVKNGSGGSINVTVVIPGNTEFGQAEPDVVIAVAAGAQAAIGPFPRSAGDAQGLVAINYSDVTSVTRALIGA